MAQRCDNCSKGILHGHAVSHAKNRLKRLFKPNLQKIKVLYNNEVKTVKLCTKCIKRFKRYGKVNSFLKLKKITTKIITTPKIAKIEEESKRTKKLEDTISIESIVGKKSE